MSLSPYALAALARELDRIAGSRSGRNQQLNASAFSLGQLVGAGVLDRSLVEQELLGAAEACGYVAKDGFAAARSTIKSGLDRGERSPRNIQSGQGSSPSMQRVPLQPVHAETAVVEDDAERIARARYLWAQRRALDDRYLRGSRGLRGPFPVTLGSLPARRERAPAMIAAFGIATEPEPGVLAIADRDVTAVHLTKLTADGSQKTQHAAQQDHGRQPKRLTHRAGPSERFARDVHHRGHRGCSKRARSNRAWCLGGRIGFADAGPC